MKIKPRRLLSLVIGAVLCGLAFYLLLSSPVSGGNRTLRLAVSAGAPEVVSSYLIQHYEAPVAAIPLLEVQAFQDCCSSQAQMALGAGDVDMAVLCSDAAGSLISQDNNYREIGTWISCSDVLAVSPEKPVQRVAYASGRSYQEEMARNCLGNSCELLPMMPSAIPYALETGAVDAGIVDVTRASRLPEGYQLHALTEHPDNRYILVVRRELVNTADFQAFMQAWRKSALDLQNSSCLETAICNSLPEDSRRKDGELWSQLNIRIPVPN